MHAIIHWHNESQPISLWPAESNAQDACVALWLGQLSSLAAKPPLTVSRGCCVFDTADGPRVLESSDYKYWNKQLVSSRLLQSLDVGWGWGPMFKFRVWKQYSAQHNGRQQEKDIEVWSAHSYKQGYLRFSTVSWWNREKEMTPSSATWLKYANWHKKLLNCRYTSGVQRSLCNCAVAVVRVLPDGWIDGWMEGWLFAVFFSVSNTGNHFGCSQIPVVFNNWKNKNHLITPSVGGLLNLQLFLC